MFSQIISDIRFAFQQLLKHPGFTLVALLSLALGIGANTAIFSIVNAVLLRALPVEDPEQLVQLKMGTNESFTNAIWEQIRDHQSIFSGALAFSSDRFNLADSGEKQIVEGVHASGDYFHVLGVPALKGRVFTADDDRNGVGSGAAVAVISYRFWQHNYGGDADIVGKTIRLNRYPFQIVGVTPPWFTGLDLDRSYDIAIPLAAETLLHPTSTMMSNRSAWWLRVVARTAPGQSLEQAEAHLKVFAPQVFAAAVPPSYSTASQKEFLKTSIELTTAKTGFSRTGDQYRTALFTLMATVGLVLLIACANIANLLLARATARQRELSVRMAVGASRGRLIRQLMTESLLLAVLGAATGLLLAAWSSRLLVGLISRPGHPLDFDLSLDARVLIFTTGATVLTAMLFGLVPAIRATRIDLNQMLKETARGSTQGRSWFSAGKTLMVGQVALSMILLVGAGLFIGTLRNLLNVNPGFDQHQVLVVTVDAEHANIDKTRLTASFQQLLRNFQNITGVESVSYSSLVPTSHAMRNGTTYPQGRPDLSRKESLAFFNDVSPGFFRTMKIPLLAGREFAESDTLTSPLVIVIGETAAKQFFGQQNPIGMTIGLDHFGVPGSPPSKDIYQVIGVAKDIKYDRLDEQPRRTAYTNTYQNPSNGTQMQFELRTAVPLAQVIPAVRTSITQLNPDIAMEFGSMEMLIDDLLRQSRVMAALSAVFGVLAALLAMIGLYGTTSYAVAQRRSEIGIRMALGAQRRSVLNLIVRQGMTPAIFGIVVGVIGALALTRVVESLLFGVHPSDPSTFVVMALLMGFVALIACALPARRASLLDPMIALRND